GGRVAHEAAKEVPHRLLVTYDEALEGTRIPRAISHHERLVAVHPRAILARSTANRKRAAIPEVAPRNDHRPRGTDRPCDAGRRRPSRSTWDRDRDPGGCPSPATRRGRCSARRGTPTAG